MALIDRRTLLGTTLAAGVLASPAAAAASDAASDTIAWPPREGFRLWPGDAPGRLAELPRFQPTMAGNPGHRELQLRGIATPMVHVFRPASPNGLALLVAPGGGYEFLAASNEGLNVARTFTALGYTVFVLIYRLPAEGWANRSDVPLQDAQRAIRLIRAHAADYGVLRIGMVGFSAGGHLASWLTSGWAERVYAPLDAADGQSARPDFAGLIYAVSTLRDPSTHAGTRDHLLGPNPSPALVERRSPVLHVDPHTPPSFLLHALDDTIVSPQCSLDWLQACRAEGAPVEAHFLARGGHGFGTGLPASNPGSLWPTLFDRWVHAASGGTSG